MKTKIHLLLLMQNNIFFIKNQVSFISWITVILSRVHFPIFHMFQVLSWFHTSSCCFSVGSHCCSWSSLLASTPAWGRSTLWLKYVPSSKVSGPCALIPHVSCVQLCHPNLVQENGRSFYFICCPAKLYTLFINIKGVQGINNIKIFLYKFL